MIERVLISNRKTYESINLTGKGKYLVQFRMVVGWSLINLARRLKDKISLLPSPGRIATVILHKTVDSFLAHYNLVGLVDIGFQR